MWYILLGMIAGGGLGLLLEKRQEAAESKAAQERLDLLRKQQASTKEEETD